MIYTAIGFFALAAILGMILLSYMLRKKETPKGIALIHGPIAAVGLVLLIIYTLNNPPGPIESVVLFSLAALGGIVVFFRDITNKPLPRWAGLVHGLIAIAGFTFLLVHAFSAG